MRAHRLLLAVTGSRTRSGFSGRRPSLRRKRQQSQLIQPCFRICFCSMSRMATRAAFWRNSTAWQHGSTAPWTCTRCRLQIWAIFYICCDFCPPCHAAVQELR